MRGLLSYMPGYRRVERSDHFIMASTWLDEASVVEAVGKQPIERPSSAGVMAGVAEFEEVVHYDLLEPIHRGLLDAPGAVLRSIEATVAPGRLDDLLRLVRDIDRELHVLRMVLGYAIGVRTVDGVQRVHSVAAWASPLQIEELAEEGRAGKTMFAALDELISDVTIVQYQAIELKLPEELADTGGRRIIAARFPTRAAAGRATAAIEMGFPSAGEAGVFVARLGGTTGKGEQHVLVARMTLSDTFGAERLIADLGGQVLYEADEGPRLPRKRVTGLQQPLPSV